MVYIDQASCLASTFACMFAFTTVFFIANYIECFFLMNSNTIEKGEV